MSSEPHADLLMATPFWIPEADLGVRCLACSRECRIPEGQTGFCRTRVNNNGRLERPYEGFLSALADDPIEKKPLYHFFSGSRVLSIGGWGCNFVCPWCQNHPISQNLPRQREQRSTSSKELVERALADGFKALAFTYNEPTVAIEFVLSTFCLAKSEGLRTVLVTNGSMGARGARALAPYLDAVNVDLKGFNAEKLRQVVQGDLGAVLASIETFRSEEIWTEVTTLVVPGFNDNVQELRQAADWLAGIGRSTVWHLSAFHPDYHYQKVGPTPVSSLELARKQGREAGLNFIYLGNVPDETSTTACPNCAFPLVERKEGRVKISENFHGLCPSCQTRVAGRWA
jgi:pyruvate formate lyase activating enzyme